MPNHDNEDLKHYHLPTRVIETPGSISGTREVLLFKYSNTSKKRTVHEKGATIGDLKAKIKRSYNIDDAQEFFLTWKEHLLEPDDLKIRDIGVPNGDGTYDRIKIFDHEFSPINVNLYAKTASIPVVEDLSDDVEDDGKSVYGDDEEDEDEEDEEEEAGPTEAEKRDAVTYNSGSELKGNPLKVSTIHHQQILFEGEPPLFQRAQEFANGDDLEDHIKKSKLIKTYIFDLTIFKRGKGYLAMISLKPRKKGGNKKKTTRRRRMRTKTRKAKRSRKHSVLRKRKRSRR